MEDYPATILEFEQQFPTEEACREYLFRLRWPDGFSCPRCGHGKAWLTNRGLHRCCQCDSQVSVTAGTVFQDSGKPLRLWFRAIWEITSQKHGVSALGLQRVLGLEANEAWLERRYLRMEPERIEQAMVAWQAAGEPSACCSPRFPTLAAR